jgi:AraC family transcriptional regulator
MTLPTWNDKQALMKNSKTAAYHQRFTKVFDYIDNNLDADLSLGKLSGVANFSKYHFHRQFNDVAGVNVFKYVQLQRLKRASYQLSFRERYRVIDIAMQAKFENAESFSRAFKKTFGTSPSEFRESPDWAPWQTKFQILNRREPNMPDTQNNPINIVNVETIKIAVLEHHGSPNAIMNSVKTFIEWRKLNNLGPSVSKTYNIFYSDPANTPDDEFHMDICASTKADVQENDFGVITKSIPGGRCAVLRHIGSDQALGQSIRYLYDSWLSESGEELRDFPCYLHRVTLYPDVVESEMITDIYLPLQ